MAFITVKSQAELDDIPLYTEDIINIEFGTCQSPAIVRNRYKHRVMVSKDSHVEAHGNSDVEAFENSFIVALDHSFVKARDDSAVVAYQSSRIEAYGDSSVMARENSRVEARENSSIEAWEKSYVMAWGDCSVTAWGNSYIVARGDIYVKAWKNSHIVARGTSYIVARGNSYIEAYDRSCVEARGNVQVVDALQGANIKLSENARTVYMPRNIEEFINFYGIKHDKTTSLFYKAVHKRTLNTLYAGDKEVASFSEYVSDYDENFKYEIGKTVASIGFDDNPEHDCGKGIHIGDKNLALEYGGYWKDFALLEVKVEIKDILLPKYSNGKVRASKVKVIREVPLEECGMYGKLLIRCRKNNEA